MSGKLKKLGVTIAMVCILVAGVLAVAVALDLVDSTAALETMTTIATITGIIGVVALSIIVMLNFGKDT